MPNIFNIFKKHDYKREEEKPEIPKEDLFKLLSIFYTFNHGNSACQPVELQYYIDNKDEDTIDFETLTKKFHEVGYTIDKVVCVTDEKITPDYVAYVPNEKEYEKRRKNHNYLPCDISYLVVSNLSGTQYIIEESMESIAFLANGGDKRAIETYKIWKNYIEDLRSYYFACPPNEEEKNEKTKKKN